MDTENTLIMAIQGQQMVEIQFRKETDQDWAVREVAPYDIYQKADKNGNVRRILLGYCWRHKNYKAAPINVYLDTIVRVEVLSERFDGSQIRRLINPKMSSNIPRSW